MIHPHCKKQREQKISTNRHRIEISNYTETEWIPNIKMNQSELNAINWPDSEEVHEASKDLMYRSAEKDPKRNGGQNAVLKLVEEKW